MLSQWRSVINHETSNDIQVGLMGHCLIYLLMLFITTVLGLTVSDVHVQYVHVRIICKEGEAAGYWLLLHVVLHVHVL